LINFNEIERKVSKGKKSTTKMKETKDLLAIKTIEEKMKDLKSKDSTDSKELSLKKMRSQNKEEMTTKKRRDLLKGK
jgi:hypothetical protein